MACDATARKDISEAMSTRFDTFRDFDRLTRDFSSRSPRQPMPMDAFRNADRVMVSFDLPGVDPASLDVTVEKDTLTVRAERRTSVSEGDRVLVSERPHGRFARRLSLGQGLDGDDTEASYVNGVLTLTIPVAEQSKARKIEISTPEPRAVQESVTGPDAADPDRGEEAQQAA
jgi:HSP20 family protein